MFKYIAEIINMALLPKAVKRIQKELIEFERAKHTTIFLEPVEEKVSHLKGLIIGPEDTPYEGGFFLFDIIPPNTYPIDPPKVKFLSPNSGTCRLHPNLYSCGKVCLSILGTWGKQDWIPCYGYEKVLFTIQALLDNNPITHEPGHDNYKQDNPESINYALCARWLTLDACVVDIFKRDLPDNFRTAMKEFFLKNFDKYIESAKKLLPHDGKALHCFHTQPLIKVRDMMERLEKLRDILSESPEAQLT